MKRLLLLFIFALGCLQIEAQKLTPKFLEGTWETKFHIIEFKGKNTKDFSINITLKKTGRKIYVLSYQFKEKALYTKTYYETTGFESIGKLIIIDENTLVEDVVSKYPGTLIYKRK